MKVTIKLYHKAFESFEMFLLSLRVPQPGPDFIKK